MSARLDLGVVVPDLRRTGGAERLALACLERWRGRFRTTLYSTGFAPEVSERLGPDVVLRTLAPRVDGESGTPERPHARVVDALLVPRLWGREIGDHDVHLAHQWPTQRIGRHPLVWYAHEPRRVLHDLRHEQDPERLVAQLTAERALDGYAWDRVFDRRHRAALSVLDDSERRDRPERIVANSDFTARVLEGILGGPRPDVVRPGVDADAFAPPEFEEPFFLALGRLDRHKRPRLLIEALELAPSARLVLVGDGPLRGHCLEVARALGVADRVELRGVVSDAERRDLLRRCRAVAFVPLNEPFGMVALEALAAGKPLVCTGEGGYAEVVDESCAWIVPPEPARIAEAFEALVADPERARALGAAGLARAREHPWEDTAEALARILEETAAARRPVAPALPRAKRLAVALRLGFGEGPAGSGWSALRAAGAADAPAEGYYASTQGSTIARQHAGLASLAPDLVLLGVPVDAAGPGVRELAAVVHHLEIADRDAVRFRCAVQARVAPGGEARVADLAALVDADLARHASHARAAAGPLLFVEPLPGCDAAALRAALAAPVERCALEVVWLPAAGADPTGAVLRVPAERSEAAWKDARSRLRAASPPPAWVILDAWNDFAAGLHLEPTRREGAERLALAVAFARELRGAQ